MPYIAAAEVFPGPYTATVERIVDGDTFIARVEIWPNIFAEASIRVRGLQAPERRGPGCEEELEAALNATEVLKQELFESSEDGRIEVNNVEADVWDGRVVADVFRPNTQRRTSLHDQLLRHGPSLFQEWTPDMDDVPWCLILSVEGGQ